MSHAKIAVRSLLALAALSALPAQAGELSLLTGLYRERKSEMNGQGHGSARTFRLGGRYADHYDADNSWFVAALAEQVKVTAPEGAKDPDPSTGGAIAFGIRHDFPAWGAGIMPFIQGAATLKKSKAVDTSLNEIEESGLYYGADVGVRFPMGTDFFLDVEAPLFESALKATRKQKDASNGNTTKTERTELYADTYGGFTDIIVSVGMKF